MAMLAQAAGAASMPFFASLWSQQRRYEFAVGVADSVSRVASLGILIASGMVTLGLPLIDLVFTGGRFTAADSRTCAVYFAVFSVSMFLWSAQAIYARAFYAAGHTIIPMIAGTAVTAVSLPVYYALYHLNGATGLAIASNVGIALQTVTIAVLLHRRHMVSLASLDYQELGRCLLASMASGVGVSMLLWAMHGMLGRLSGDFMLRHARLADALVLLAGSFLWLAVTKIVLEKSGSALPRVAMKRLGLA
jgi:putative peptidoglycan lipid II flippase